MPATPLSPHHPQVCLICGDDLWTKWPTAPGHFRDQLSHPLKVGSNKVRSFQDIYHVPSCAQRFESKAVLCTKRVARKNRESYCKYVEPFCSDLIFCMNEHLMPKWKIPKFESWKEYKTISFCCYFMPWSSYPYEDNWKECPMWVLILNFFVISSCSFVVQFF